MTHLRLAHSPDPDDAFMWWPLVGHGGGDARVDTGEFTFELVTDDIESLNARSMSGDLEITAISCAQYPHVADRYAFTSCGASLGDGYGPKLVAPSSQSLDSLLESCPLVLVPGERTSALAAMRLMCPDDSFRWKAVAFDSISDRLAGGEADAGILIHEGQLTWEQEGLHLIEDLGVWWEGVSGLPLPLGGNVVRRDLEEVHGPGTLMRIAGILHQSVRWALEHRDEALDHALEFGRGISRDQADAFVTMYVNRWTLDYEERGRSAVASFLGRAAQRGILPSTGPIDFISSDAADAVSPNV
ncbi:MAG: ABC transporter substrate-binding protein [Phycisphaerales bacterium]|nr:ABC transporter substrate-binding protein [Phycisphaerales bacterium]